MLRVLSYFFFSSRAHAKFRAADFGVPQRGDVLELDCNLLNTGKYTFYIQSTILPSLQTKVNSMFFTASQIVTDMSELSLAMAAGGSKDDLPVIPIALHFLSLVTIFIDLSGRVASDLETLFHLREYSPVYVKHTKQFPISVWDCDQPSLEEMYANLFFFFFPPSHASI